MLEILSGRAFLFVRAGGELPPFLSRELRCAQLWTGVFVAGAALFLQGCTSEKTAAPPQSGMPVTVASATTKDVPVEVRVIGTVEAYSTVAVKSQVTGELKQVHFKEGDEVRAGDRLFLVDPRPFEWELKRLEANLQRNVAQGKQAQANLARDSAQAKLAEVETSRFERLVEQGIVAREEYDRARANLDALEAEVSADQAAIENSEQAVRADRAASENARLQLDYSSIESPISGRTGSLMVHEGNVVKANETPLVTINQISPLYVSFAVPEQTLPDIKRYMAAGNLRVVANPANDEQGAVQGELTFVDNAVDSNTGTIRLKATFANKERRLWPGQFVNVVMTLTRERGAVVVPSQAVQAGQSGPYVFVVKPDLSVESRPVIVGRTVGGEAVIARGVRSGERVVTDGHLRLVPGSIVEIKSSLEVTQGARP
jgi:membrane fusion protein, multidrug efflux system